MSHSIFDLWRRRMKSNSGSEAHSSMSVDRCIGCIWGAMARRYLQYIQSTRSNALAQTHENKKELEAVRSACSQMRTSHTAGE
jgi:hypothetical protein